MPIWFGRIRLVCLVAVTLAALTFVWLPAFAPSSLEVGGVRGGRGLWFGVVLVPAQLVFAVATRHLLARPLSPQRRAWSYRLVFLLSATAGLALWAYWARPASPGAALWPLGLTWLGAFAGGLLATSLDEGLWEDSFPPPQQVADRVRRHHLRLFGQPPPTPRSKRLFDLALALAGLIVLAPVWLLSAFLVWLEDPGPVFFVKNSVGKGGANFRQVKFRSMVRNAEEETGPIPAREQDQRTLIVGRFLRKTALDELPQLANILRGEMSFVGPRPLRTVVIHEFLRDLPQFAERHLVQPGIAGLSQVRGGYYVTPLQRLRFDRIYVRHMSLRFDIRMLLEALQLVLWLRWGKRARRRLSRRSG